MENNPKRMMALAELRRTVRAALAKVAAMKADDSAEATANDVITSLDQRIEGFATHLEGEQRDQLRKLYGDLLDYDYEASKTPRDALRGHLQELEKFLKPL